MHGNTKIKLYILCLINPFSDNRAVYEIMCKNIVQPDRPHMAISTSHALCVPEN